jgi:DNA-binding response OmpR family regulator
MVMQKNKIIIVDDDDFLLDMYATKFDLSDIEVDGCRSGMELLEKLRAGEKPDLIVLDIIMAGMSGVETLRKMRMEKLGENIPVVILTNQNEGKDMVAAKNLNIATYIVKSAATPLEVVKEISEIIKKSKS